MKDPVIVVGGGVVGLATALALRDADLPVQVIERNPAPAKESSWAGGGILCPLRPWAEPEAVQALYRRSRASYARWFQRLAPAGGPDPAYRESGILWRLPEGDERDRARRWLQAEGLAFEDRHDGLYCPTLGQVRPPRLGAALAAACRNAGVEIRCGVEALPWMERGRLRGLHIGGDTLCARAVVLCAGAWSGVWAGLAGLSLPVAPVKGQMLRFRLESSRDWPIHIGPGAYVIPRGDGEVIVGSTLEHSGFDKALTEAARAELHAAAAGLCPALEDAVPVQQWAGLRPGSPDGVPRIGATALPGLWLNTGHYRNGIALAPASAERLADALLWALHHG